MEHRFPHASSRSGALKSPSRHRIPSFYEHFLSIPPVISITEASTVKAGSLEAFQIPDSQKSSRHIPSIWGVVRGLDNIAITFPKMVAHLLRFSDLICDSWPKRAVRVEQKRDW